MIGYKTSDKETENQLGNSTPDLALSQQFLFSFYRDCRSFPADTEKEIRKITTTIRNMSDYPTLAEVVDRYELISGLYEERIHSLIEKSQIDHLNFSHSLDRVAGEIQAVATDSTAEAPDKNAALIEIFQKVSNFQMSAYPGLAVLCDAVHFPEAKALFNLGVTEKEESTLDLADIRDHYLSEPEAGMLQNYSTS
jgi:hypothetical protein